MRFKVLGPLKVTRDDDPLTLGGPKQRAVLAHLLVRANDLVPADVLIDQVWGEEPPEAARGTLHSYISHLRKALGADRIESRPPGYVLHVSNDELDAARFASLLNEARFANGSPGRASSVLREALALWEGPPFADLAAEPALASEIARLDELHWQALEERIAADLAEGRHAEVIGELESLTRELPLRERLLELLMLALYRSRRPADALGAFERAKDALAQELGVDPSPDLRRLHERILREDPKLDLEGEPLRGYRLLEQVGEGAFGVVHRAVQPQIGREVAIKAVHPELANHPDFVRRFEREAQIVARLEHPHVVPLYDYWREPNAAYLVMRFLRGGSVEDLLQAGPLEPSRAVAIVDQIASALAAAHRQGVVHRDVKPGNVLLDEHGNAYLTDFGVALDADSPERSTGTMMRGTPAYLSPEQIRLDPASPRSDTYALGVVAFEMLTGSHPFPESSLTALLEHHANDPLPSVHAIRPDLPRGVDDAIARATAKDPRDRFAHIEGFAAALRAAVAGVVEAPPVPAGETRNPYKGLRAFLEADATDFFGREAVTKRLLQSLADDDPAARFLAVVGPSGSGKSSVVRAGLVPALRRGAIPGSERWYVIEVVPGHRPFRELETALLTVAVEPPPSLMEELERDELGLLRAVDRILPDRDAELLIVLDQFEEAFTLVEDETERARFLACLRAAALEPASRVRIVATLRADFYDAPLSVAGFGDLLAARTEAITPMSPEDLERAIVAPAEQAGLVVEPRLLAEMIAEVADRPGALPLLQYALTELAERADGGTLTLEAYRKIGRVSGALARRAEQLFEQMNEGGREACRHLFLRLVTLGEGTEDTRRRVRRSELGTLTDPQTMDAVVETFGRHRLLSFDRDPDTREPTVEIAHEALLREWSRLRGWIDDAREDLRQRAKVSAATVEWLQADRSVDYLMSGVQLAQAEGTAAADTTVRLTEDEHEFLDASFAHRDAEAAAERMRHARELTLERRARTRLRGLVALLAATTLLAASLTAVAVGRGREAERGRDESTIAALTAGSLSNLNSDPESSVLLALHAVNLSAEIDLPVPSETTEALHWAMHEAGIEYPVRGDDLRRGDPQLVAGPLGVRGIYDLQLPILANTARNGITHSLSPEQCERFFEDPECPALPSSFPLAIDAERVESIPRPDEKPLLGTQVTLFGGNDQQRVAIFEEEFAAFTDETGIDVRLVGNPLVNDYVAQSVAEGDPPDIAVIPQPGTIQEFSREGHLIDLASYRNLEALEDDQSPYLVSLGTVGDDGSWPSSEGSTYGVFVNLNLKSLVWYPEPELRAEGYAPPRTWDELIGLSDRLVRDGQTPWCMGWESGGASGWPGTDWIENLLLKAAGPQVYDQWTFHEIPFDSAPVREAFERLGQILFTDGYLAKDAVEQNFDVAQRPMVKGDPPGCWLHQFPNFAASFIPDESAGTTTDIVPFPSIGNPSSAVVGGGDMIGVFSDRPEVREVVRYMLSSEYGERLTETTPFISANRRFDVANYDPFERRQAEVIYDALAEDSFRFDASDLMPPEIGAALFWDAMMRYAREGPQSLDAILAELDAAWPDDG